MMVGVHFGVWRASALRPLYVAGLMAWLDASQPASLRQNSDGSGAVGSDGDPVGYWGDLSGNGRQFTQSAAAARPTFKAGILNGLPVIRFDGVDDRLGSAPIAMPSAMSVLAVARTLVTPSAHMVCGSRTGSTTQKAWELRLSSASQALITGYQSGGSYAEFIDTAAASPASWTVYCGVWNSDMSHELFVNGGGGGSTAGSTPRNTPTQAWWVGDRWDNTSNRLNGDIAEIAVFNRALTSDERLQLTRYLGSKWSIPVA